MNAKDSDKVESSPLDFAPFDPLANLEAVSEVIKTVRHLSWSYAGDIARTVIKIGKTFLAGRCVVCVCGEPGVIEVYEYSDGTLEPLQGYFESPEGQAFLARCLELAPDCSSIASDDVGLPDEHLAMSITGVNDDDVPESLRRPTSYVFPLRHQYEKRHVVKPGLLLLQEPLGLARWNKRFLDSVVVVAEYLAMVIECERLYGIVRSETPKAPE